MPKTNGIFDIAAFGAKPDGRTMNTAAFRQAVEACNAAGGGRVFCGPGEFLTGPIDLLDNVELHLSPGCRILSEDGTGGDGEVSLFDDRDNQAKGSERTGSRSLGLSDYVGDGNWTDGHRDVDGVAR